MRAVSRPEGIVSRIASMLPAHPGMQVGVDGNACPGNDFPAFRKRRLRELRASPNFISNGNRLFFRGSFDDDFGEVGDVGKQTGNAIQQVEAVFSQSIVFHHHHDLVEEIIDRAFDLDNFFESL